MLEIIVSLLILCGLLFLYFLPTYVAYKMERKNAGAIFALNLLLGWTFIGWVIALVWSAMVDK